MDPWGRSYLFLVCRSGDPMLGIVGIAGPEAHHQSTSRYNSTIARHKGVVARTILRETDKPSDPRSEFRLVVEKGQKKRTPKGPQVSPRRD